MDVFKSPLTRIDYYLNKITMYRLLLFGLATLAAVALLLSGFGILGYSSFKILLPLLIVLIATSYITNKLLSRLYNLPVSDESALITALILFFIISAPSGAIGWAGVIFAALVAIISKFILTYRGSNIFNPAAFGVLVVGLIGIGDGAWWVARPILLLPVTIFGLLILRKMRKFSLFFVFFFASLALIIFNIYSPNQSLISALITALTLFPIVFLGTVMLTEPATMPAQRNHQLVYGAIVGVIFGSQLNFAFLSASPHLALIIGNIYALFVTLRPSTKLKLVAKKELAPNIYDFSFKPDKKIKFNAGQYMEFTLPDVKWDARGNRHTFSIASPPQSDLLHIGVKFNQPSSTYKEKLLALKVGDEIVANRLAGDFTLPTSTKQPLVFVAGGIGITPFISMIRFVLESDKNYDITLYYFLKQKEEMAYREVLNRAKERGIKIFPRIGIDERLTESDVEKHKDAIFYLSGPPGLVSGYKKQLSALKIRKIKTDYFSGY